MEPLTLIAVSAIVLAVMGVVVGVYVIVTLGQLRESARRVDELGRRLEPTILEVEQTVREWRELGARLANTAESAEKIAHNFEGVGSKAAKASQVILSGIGGPVGRAVALWSAFRTGADVFFRVTGRKSRSNHKEHDGKTAPVSRS